MSRYVLLPFSVMHLSRWPRLPIKLMKNVCLWMQKRKERSSDFTFTPATDFLYILELIHLEFIITMISLTILTSTDQAIALELWLSWTDTCLTQNPLNNILTWSHCKLLPNKLYFPKSSTKNLHFMSASYSIFNIFNKRKLKIPTIFMDPQQ